MPQITITGSNATTNALTLSDNGSTTTSKGSIVTWVIAPNAGPISSISAIHKYPTSVDIFSTDPHQIGQSKNWQATVSSSIAVPVEETYYIDWLDAAGNIRRFDPRLRVND